MNEHDEVRELLELAAVEPGGLDRLEAGDTPEATFVVGHLAGCPDCLEEMARLRRAETLLRPVLAAEPDPALRERTLAYVRAVGVARDAPGSDALGRAPQPELGSIPGRAAAGAAPTGRRRVIGIPAWVGTLAAALVIGLVGGALIGGGGGPPADDAAAALHSVASDTASLLARSDVREVVLVDATGTPAGSLVVSPSAGHVVVMASGLDEPAAGTEYRCWVGAGDVQTTIGTMRWVAGVAWWSGDVDLSAAVPPGTVYGVSLVEIGSSDPGTVVLTGGL